MINRLNSVFCMTIINRRHFHLEKPLASSLAEMRAVVALAGEKKLLLQTGFMWRYNPGFEAIIEAVRKGWLGEVFLVRGERPLSVSLDDELLVAETVLQVSEKL
jgi:hypothetical protein